MSCENDDCIFDGTPKEIFKWLRPVMSFGFVCTAMRVALKSKSNLIFDTCDIKQLECKLKSSFVYWTKEIRESSEMMISRERGICNTPYMSLDHQLPN
ncbi:hypothetical protein BpHYR1_003790 [Brachionus plicatilis]|uniref:Uncharacterized protein n=1 Tax=Brachionus plicatilis TaxID=10195 RepID=A0A3M7RPE9_BRAPC|nr:hypothetical protein BpHYR1_003790 [Brachionus plicatilis]